MYIRNFIICLLLSLPVYPEYSVWLSLGNKRTLVIVWQRLWFWLNVHKVKNMSHASSYILTFINI